MLRSLAKYIFEKLGYRVVSLHKDREESRGFVLYTYLKEDGTFDYDKYRRIQEAGNKQKINFIWVIEENIAFLSEYIKSTIGSPRFGICHGTRRGKEQEWFRKYLGCDVIGTEISDTAESFPNTIRWDFHEVKPEWVNSVDFIYSNSFDHSYDPEKCLNAWMSCLRKGGICILEHSSLHEVQGANELDPFGADIHLMPFLITTWGKGNYCVRQLLMAPTKNSTLKHLQYIVIQKL